MNPQTDQPKNQQPNYDFILKPDGESGSSPAKKKKLNTKVIILIVLVVFLVIMGIVGLLVRPAEEGSQENVALSAGTPAEANKLFIEQGVKRDVNAALSLMGGQFNTADQDIRKLALGRLMTNVDFSTCELQNETTKNDTTTETQYFCSRTDGGEINITITAVQEHERAVITAYGVKDEEIE